MNATARVALMTVRGEGRKALSTFALPVSAFCRLDDVVADGARRLRCICGQIERTRSRGVPSARRGCFGVDDRSSRHSRSGGGPAWARAVATNDLPRCDSSDPPLARSLRCALRNRVSRAWPVR